ncbi:MAG TPA: GNAT family N-acetyltransferase [Bryobacteraceae bacterium]|nr:GNAT family N-acetyltransferase [Bryobacteraceae bacterium]
MADDLAMLGCVLHACVQAGASVSFVLPFSREQATAFWRERVLPAVQAGSLVVLIAREDRRIVGTVQLDLDTPPNQRHRADVKKLLVHPDARRRKIGRRLMWALEEQAREARRSLLTLDTQTGGFAEPLYLSLGYISIGVIPRYALQADSGMLEGTTFMYKELAPQASKPLSL